MTPDVKNIIDLHKVEVNTSSVNDLIDSSTIRIARNWSSDLIRLPDTADDFDSLLENSEIDYDFLLVLVNKTSYDVVPKVVLMLRRGVISLDGTVHNNMEYAINKMSRDKLEQLR